LTQSDFFSLDGISKRFGIVQALDNVSIAFRPGEVLALVGENGAGKSTMMRILEGVFGPDSGTVRHGATPIIFGEPDILREQVSEDVTSTLLPGTVLALLSTTRGGADCKPVAVRFGSAL